MEIEKYLVDRPRATTVPLYIFRDRTLSPLEAISEFLKEKKHMSFHEIAQQVNRDDRTIWTCVNRARKKREAHPQEQTIPEEAHIEFPIALLTDRSLSPLEKISLHLHAEQHMTYHQIATLLNRDDRTIWTCVNRAKKKLA